MSVKRIAVTTVSAVAGYTIANMALNSLGVLPSDSDFGVGAFEIIESLIIATTVIVGNSLL